jgi:hypothetical protein
MNTQTKEIVRRLRNPVGSAGNYDEDQVADLIEGLTAEVERLELMLEDHDLAEVNAFEAGWTMYADSGITDRLPDEMAFALQHYLAPQQGDMIGLPSFMRSKK